MSQWIQSNIKPDMGMNNNFFHNLKFHVLQSLGEWMRIFGNGENILLKTLHWIHSATKQRCPWKLGQSCGKHKGKHWRYSVILVKLLEKFTRIRPHGTLQNTTSLIQSIGEENPRKRVVSADFQMHRPKICRNCVHGK